ncbi:hypothetical protein PR003_g5825 [Phytophthora rubi]|uniref:Uncharacterized protein n=1 Tax=Phytophthora rubi TaxID=129364 RepID=A0A6A3MS49_9STRA|nr:hypothetical protein PR002_g7303 [Phytophthora rubi]KAE9046281.1 hypothetical protein PR001_g4638 [Phytophthora rubi]KAE9349553.1 hypothetical protein PR003_g5825 [Phytophthora rubi]
MATETRPETIIEDAALAGLAAAVGCEQGDGGDMQLSDAMVCVATVAETLAVRENYFCRQRIIYCIGKL